MQFIKTNSEKIQRNLIYNLADEKSEFIDSHLSQRIDDVSIEQITQERVRSGECRTETFSTRNIQKKIDYLTITNLRNLNLIP